MVESELDWQPGVEGSVLPEPVPESGEEAKDIHSFHSSFTELLPPARKLIQASVLSSVTCLLPKVVRTIVSIYQAHDLLIYIPKNQVLLLLLLFCR